LALRAGEFLVLVCSSVLAAFVLGSLLLGPLVGLVVAGAVALVSQLVLRMKIGQRRKAFGDQLPDVVQMLSGSLRAGYALGQAIDSVAREAPSPAADELHRIVVETRLGRDLNESLRAAAERLGSQDFDWVVQAIEIQREVGGDLAEVLDNVAHTIRERTQLHRHVRALTAEGRISAYILLALPPFLALALSVINPEYMAKLTHGPGLVMALGGVVLMGVGAVWFKVLCRLQY
jgi:tight adherence protein B